MARAPYPDIETLPDELRTFVQRFDPLMNVFHMLAHTGPALPHFMRLGNAILFKGRLDPELREIAILRVGHLLGAPMRSTSTRSFRAISAWTRPGSRASSTARTKRCSRT